MPFHVSSRRAIALATTAAMAVGVVTLAGCASIASQQATTKTPAPSHTSSSVSADLFATHDTSAVLAGLSWGTPQTVEGVVWDSAEVTTGLAGSTFTVTTNSIPNHERDTYYAVPQNGVLIPDANSATVAKDPTTAQQQTFTFPSSPQYSNSTTEAPLGSIGIMISGAVLFNPFEADGSTVAMANNFTVTKDGVTASFVDHCSGHPSPQGNYHYHANSSCVTRQVDATDQASHIIGLALDGFPIYGAYDIAGAEVTSDKLDECNGIFSATPEFPNGIYHYVLPNTTDATSSIRCFHGVVDASQIRQMPPMMGQMNQPGQAGPPAQGGQMMPPPMMGQNSGSRP